MERFFRYGLTLLICLVALGQFVQVITRYVLEIPVMGLEETMLYPTLWLYMMGSVNASRENTQIRANVLEIFIKSDRGHAILALIGEALSIIISSWLVWWAWDFTKYAKRVWKESPTLYFPTFWADVALMTALVLMTLFSCWHFYRYARALATGDYASVSTQTADEQATEYGAVAFDPAGKERYNG